MKRRFIHKVFNRLISKGFFRFLPDKPYLKLAYWARTGKRFKFNKVCTYDEKLQFLKVYNHNPYYSQLADKIEVKAIVSKLIGEEFIIPTIGIYDDFDDIDFEKLPKKFVLKCSHDSGGIIVCENKDTFNIDNARRKIKKLMKRNYYYRTREWHYKNIKPRILIEEYVDLGSKDNHFDYKFMCFNGVVKYLFLDIGVIGKDGSHAENYYRNIYDSDFNLQEFRETRNNSPYKISKPLNYDKMISIAELLSKDIPHVRIDLYNVNGKILFGEYTFFHGSGFNEFIPEKYGNILGDCIDLSVFEK